MKLVLATANPDKAREIQAVLAGVELVPRPDEVPEVDETEDSLEGNARLKAQALCRATGLPALADDTGLEVEALDGAPGIYSSRWAGEGARYEDNVAKMMEEMRDRSDRRASFRTVVVIAFPDGSELGAEGRVDGAISVEPRGAGGFGYDPVFVPDEGGGRTFAEMSPEEKNRISHRARALRALAARLVAAGGATSP